MARSKKEEPEIESRTLPPKPIDPEICYDCDSSRPNYLVSSLRVKERPICKDCIAPYCFSMFWKKERI